MKKIILSLFVSAMTLAAAAQNVGVGTNSPSSKLDVSGDIALRDGGTISVSTGTIALPTAKNSVYRISSSSAYAVTTITGGNDGMMLTLINTGTGIMTVTNTSVETTNTILTNTGANLVGSSAITSVTMLYNANLTQWVVISAEGFVSSASSTTNIYTTNGTLTGARTLTQNGNALSIGNDAANNNLTLGSTNGTSTTTIDAGTGGAIINSNGATTTTAVAVNANAVTTGTGLAVASSGTTTGLTSGSMMSISSVSTAGTASSSSYLAKLTRSGANANSTHTAYGIYSAVTNTGTSSTNIGGFFSASGATNNNAGIFQADYTSTAPNQVVIEGFSNANQQLMLGYNTSSNYGSIQSIKQGTSAEPLALNPGGGNVGIGNTSPSTLLHIGTTTNSTSSYATFSTGNGSQTRSWQIGVPYGNTTTSSPNYGFTITDGIATPSASNTPFSIDFNTHNVGLCGTITPGAPLDVESSNTTSYNPIAHLFMPSNTGGGNVTQMRMGVGAAGDNCVEFRFVYNSSGSSTNLAEIGLYGTTGVAINGNGWLGVGTTSPSAPIDVETSTSISSSGYSYGLSNGNGPNEGYNSAEAVSIRTNQNILCGGALLALSDARIKNIIGQSDAAADLSTINKIRITDYTMRDEISHGTKQFKKVIAQQLKEVYPLAVRTSPMGQCIPNIYHTADRYEIHGKEVVIDIPLAITDTNVKVGVTCKFYIGDKNGKDVEAKGTITAFSATELHITTEKPLDADSLCDNLFVYGTEIHDLLNVDYDAISMLNVSATQELSKQLEAEKAKNKILETKVATLEQQNADTKSDVDKLKASIETMQQILESKAQK